MSAIALGACVLLTVIGIVMLAPTKIDLHNRRLSENRQAEAGFGIVLVILMVFAAYCAGKWL